MILKKTHLVYLLRFACSCVFQNWLILFFVKDIFLGLDTGGLPKTSNYLVLNHIYRQQERDQKFNKKINHILWILRYRPDRKTCFSEIFTYKLSVVLVHEMLKIGIQEYSKNFRPVISDWKYGLKTINIEVTIRQWKKLHWDRRKTILHHYIHKIT